MKKDRRVEREKGREREETEGWKERKDREEIAKEEG